MGGGRYILKKRDYIQSEKKNFIQSEKRDYIHAAQPADVIVAEEGRRPSKVRVEDATARSGIDLKKILKEATLAGQKAGEKVGARAGKGVGVDTAEIKRAAAAGARQGAEA